MLSAARALNGHNPGLACNLGTGSFVVYYDGKGIAKQAPGIGYILGDEGSGAYLGKKVLQYYLYNTFDEELRFKFDGRFNTTAVDILENVYRKPLANRYLATFCLFLSENRGHYMIENIIEDGLNDFFFTHLCKFTESWTLPIHFVGGVSFAFSDVIKELCHSYEFELGTILKNPMEGLIQYHI
jgi:N-acetylglucosamine kinase-like BadF-type ATPase